MFWISYKKMKYFNFSLYELHLGLYHISNDTKIAILGPKPTVQLGVTREPWATASEDQSDGGQRSLNVRENSEANYYSTYYTEGH